MGPDREPLLRCHLALLSPGDHSRGHLVTQVSAAGGSARGLWLWNWMRLSPARHRPKHSPITTPGKPEERSAGCPPIRRCSSFSPHLNQPAALGLGAARLTPGIFMAMKYICTPFRPTDILPSGPPQVFIVTPVMIFR